MKDCGSCCYFVKWKADNYGGGLCEAKDGRTKTDHGHKCKMWTGIKYNRQERKDVND